MDTLADMAAAVVDAAARVLAAAGAPAVGAQGPVAEGAGDTEQRISRTVPGLPRGNRGGAQVSVADVRVHDCLLGAAFADGAELTLLFVPARNTARARQKGWGP